MFQIKSNKSILSILSKYQIFRSKNLRLCLLVEKNDLNASITLLPTKFIEISNTCSVVDIRKCYFNKSYDISKPWQMKLTDYFIVRVLGLFSQH